MQTFQNFWKILIAQFLFKALIEMSGKRIYEIGAIGFHSYRKELGNHIFVSRK